MHVIHQRCWVLSAIVLLALIASGCGRPPSAGDARVGSAVSAVVDAGAVDPDKDHTLQVRPDDLQRMGIETIALTPAHWQSELHGIATVIDPQALFQLMSEQSIAAAALRASSANMKRIESLYAIGGNASQQERETFQAQLSQDLARTTAVRRQLQQQWGERFTAGDAQALTDSIAAGRRALVRIEMGAAGGPMPSWHAAASANVQFIGSADRYAIESAWIAPTAILSHPGPVWLALVKTPNRLSVDARGQASVLQSADAGVGVMVPRSALVYAQDAACAYVDLGGGRFQRRALDLSRPLDAGYFVSADYAVGERVVIAGAGLLLAVEIGHDSEEDD